MKKLLSYALIILLVLGGSVDGMTLWANQVSKTASAMQRFSMWKGGRKVFSASKKIKSCSSSNRWVATVQKRGKRSVTVKAKHAGTAKITVRYKRGKSTFKVRVKSRSSYNYDPPTDNSNVKPVVKTPTPSAISTSKPTAAPSLESNIQASVEKLKSGMILFSVKNNNSQFLYKISVTYALYNSAGTYISDWYVYAYYVPGGKTFYESVSPATGLFSSELQRMDPAKTKVTKIEVEQNKDCMSMDSQFKGSIKTIQEEGENKLEITLSNTAQKEAYYCICVLFKDSSGNIIDAQSLNCVGFMEGLSALDTRTYTWDMAKNVFTGEHISSAKAELYVYSGDV